MSIDADEREKIEREKIERDKAIRFWNYMERRRIGERKNK